MQSWRKSFGKCSGVMTTTKPSVARSKKDGTMTIDIYPAMIHEGDLTPGPFGDDIDDICNAIHKACKGWGTDEAGLIKAIGAHNQETRCKVAIRYKEIHGKELVDVMKSECGSGDFGTALQYLAVSPDVAECMMIKKACAGMGTNEDILYPILCGRSNKEIEMLKKQYFKTYSKDLTTVIASELSGDLEKVFITCLQGSEEEMDPDHHTEEKAKEDAKEIYKMGQGKFLGTDEVQLFKILAAAPQEHLKAVNLAYAELYGYTLFKGLEKELSGKVEKAGLYMLGMKLKPHETVAKLIDEACAGFGTNELLLTCTLIRYQGVMKEVMMSYIDLYSQTVEEKVKSEVRGDYEKLLLEICGAVDQS